MGAVRVFINWPATAAGMFLDEAEAEAEEEEEKEDNAC